MRVHTRVMQSVSGRCASLREVFRRPATVADKSVNVCCESLEPRQLMAAVSWTGSAGDNLWQTPSNWSTNTVPTITDDVTISVPASDPTIVFNGATGDRSIKSLDTAESISFQGGSLAVTNAATFSRNLVLQGGTLTGGTFTGSNGATLELTSTGSFLKDVIWNGELLLNSASARLTVSGTTTFQAARLTASGAILRFAPGYVLQAPIFAEGTATGMRYVTVAADAPGNLTIAPGGSIRLMPSTAGDLTIWQSQAGALINNGLVSAEATGRSVFIQPDSIINNGLMRALAGTLSIGATGTNSWADSVLGTVTATGANLTFGGAWTNAGTVVATNSAVSLGGTMTTQGINYAGFALTNSSITLLRGTLDNTGATLILSPATAWNLIGGKITGGSIVQSPGSMLVPTTGECELNDVAISGDLVVGATGRVVLTGNTTFPRLVATSGSRVAMSAGFQLNVELSGSGTRLEVRSAGPAGDVTIGTSGAIRLAGGTGLTLVLATGLRLINNGEVRIDKGTVDSTGGTFVNNGIFRLAAGTGAYFTTTNIDATGGTATWMTGLGNFEVGKTFDNTGQTLTMNAATGSWKFNGGILKGGSLVQQDGQMPVFNTFTAQLQDVQIAADLTVQAGGSVAILGTTTFTAVHLLGSGSRIVFPSGYLLNVPVIAEGAAAGTRWLVLSGPVTFGPGALVQLAAGAGGGFSVTGTSASLTNQGVIENLAAGRTLSIDLPTVDNTVLNTGIIRCLAGTLDCNTTLTNTAGSITGAPGATVTLSQTLDARQGTGVLAASGGGFYIKGTVLNTGRTLLLNSSTNSWTIWGGKISGGIVDFDGVPRTLPMKDAVTLADVELRGQVVLDTASAQATIQGTTTFQALRLSAANALVDLAAGVTLNSLISAEGPASGLRTVRLSNTSGGGVVQIGTSGAIVLAAGCGGTLTISQATPGSLVNHGLIASRASSGILTIQGPQLENTGVLESSAGTFTLAATLWSSVGDASLRVDHATFNAAGNWSTVGTMVCDTATLNLGGVGTLPKLALTGSNTLVLSGVLTNDGNSFDWDASNGTISLSGGSISGGAMRLTGGAVLNVSGSTTLANIALLGDLISSADLSNLTISGSTSFGTARLMGNVFITLASGYVMTGSVRAEGAAAGPRGLYYGDDVTLAASSSVKLVTGCGGDLALNRIPDHTGSLTNNGTIAGEAPGRNLALAGSVTNAGQISQSDGILGFWIITNSPTGSISASNSTLNFFSNLINAGLISVANTSLLLAGSVSSAGLSQGHFVRTGGTFTLTGTIFSGLLRLSSDTGSIILKGGTLANLTLERHDGATVTFTTNGVLLDSVVFDGEILLNAPKLDVSLTGTTSFTALRLQEAEARVTLLGGLVLNSPIIADGPAQGARYVSLGSWGGVNSTTVIIGPSGSIRHAPGCGGVLISNRVTSLAITLVNQGLISAANPNFSFNLVPSTFTNAGVVEADGGKLGLQPSSSTTNFQPQFTLIGGTWRVSHLGSILSTLTNVRTLLANVELDGAQTPWNVFTQLNSVGATGSLTLRGGMLLNVAPSTGTLTNTGLIVLEPGCQVQVAGNFSQIAGAILRLQVAGTTPTTYSRLSATGQIQLAGKLEVVATNGYSPVRFDTQNLLTSVGATTGTFASVTLPAPANPDWRTTLVYSATGVQMLTTSIIDFNNDGVIDLDDFFSFFNGWDTSNSSVDLDGDGEVTLADYFVFFNLFDLG